MNEENKPSEEIQNDLPKSRECTPEEEVEWRALLADKNDDLETAANAAEDLAVSAEVAHLAMTLDFEKLAPHSVLVIKLPADNPLYLDKIQRAVVQGIIGPRLDLLKEKKLGVMFMTTQDSIELLSEEDMNKSGWYRKVEEDDEDLDNFDTEGTHPVPGEPDHDDCD